MSVALFSALVALGCGGESDGTASNGNGKGGSLNLGGAGSGGSVNLGGGANGTGTGGGAASGSGGGAGYCGSTLTGTIRDFKIDHPDFEYVIATETGIVKPDLGSDGKPVYASASTTQTTTGKANFDQWYNDVPGVNMSTLLPIPLTKGSGNTFSYDNPAFFPIDGKLFGNETNPRNYHFTFELHTKFVYLGGEVFTFRGDDDLFVFINGKLGIDLGGVHGALTGTIDLDQQATNLGISKGNTYPLDFFFAERHTSESNFRIETTIASFVDCGPIVQ